MSDFKFSCPACGQHISSDTSNAGMSIACPACQTVLVVPQPPAAAPAHPALSIAASQARHTASEAGHHAEMMSQTHLQPQAAGPGGQKTSGFAIASFVCSLTFCVGFIPGIICGHLARRELRQDRSLKGGGFATAGLIISYFTVAFCIGFFALGMTGFVNAFKKAFGEAKQKQQEIMASHPSTTATPPANDSNTSSATNDSLWTLNLMTAQFPDQPAAGKIHGQDFTVEGARAQNGNITLRQGKNAVPDREITIFTFLKPAESLAGKTYDISPANSDLSVGPVPHVHLGWKETDGNIHRTKIYPNGYALKLELGAAGDDGKIPGKIYLCLPDAEKSYVAGTFELEVKKAPAKKKKKEPANWPE